MSEAKRHYFYGVSAAVLALLVVRGFVSSDEASALENVLIAVFGVGPAALANRNTSTGR